MKIITYNVNGIRAAMKKGLLEWLGAANADAICFQETKASLDQIDHSGFVNLGFEHFYWFSAEKKGYSGVAIYSKQAPLHIEYGMNNAKYDSEGRVIRLDYSDFSLMSVYMPSGTSGDERQGFKYEWLDDFFDYILDLRKKIPNLVICGDFNICHKEIDIHNPVSNKNSSGFLPEERAWLSKFFETGFTDCFRHFNQEPHHYTWWSSRTNARERNIGWRIDYFAATENLNHKLKNCKILTEAIHSDHCPVWLEIA